jgi:glutaredoxin 3
MWHPTVVAARVVVYSSAFCVHCFTAKRLLNARGIPFDEIDVTSDREGRKRLARETGQRTVPWVFIDGRLIGGSRELYDLDRRGELQVLIGAPPSPE